ncbi:hypothetical protein SLS60_007110 [Paraconiothyrium brasiliense]|uniref:Transcription initiation factor TFIID subunit 8 n=1 Tax=Paraconiothyrium brasiliense TaxID=300254 RepID=A0ABR3R8P0_9PLEO
MPGIISPLSASGTGTIAGMKRPYEEVSVPTYGETHPKKRKVVHRLRHTQPVSQFVEPLGGGFGAADDGEFVNAYLRRAIAIQCKGVGFDGAKPEAIEAMAARVHDYMSHFTDNIRKSMSSARRTVPVPHDFVYALNSVGLTGSGVLAPHLDTGDLPASFLQPAFAPPEPAELPPPDLEGMLGPELSGRADKESRKYIPAHFPAFPPKHTWMATPVYAKREVDPHTIRERAAKEGVEAEKSLRRLMEKKKEGDRKKNASRAQPQRSQVAIKREELWRTCLREALEEEEEDEAHKLREAQRRDAQGFASELDIQLIEEANKAANELRQAEQDEDKTATEEAKKAGETYIPPTPEERREKRMQQRMEQRVTVNYGRQFWRKNKRDH